MKALSFFLLLAVGLLGLSGCQETLRGSDVYTFPESPAQIAVTLYAQGKEQEFLIAPEKRQTDAPSAAAPFIQWFCALELKACKAPEAVEGNEAYTFTVGGEDAFTYDYRGDEAFVLVKDKWFAVQNPSLPPLEEAPP